MNLVLKVSRRDVMNLPDNYYAYTKTDGINDITYVKCSKYKRII